MDKEEYEDLLELQNNYCDCPELKSLFSLRKICSSLIAQSKIEEAKRPIMKYNAKMSVLLNKGKIEAILHEAPHFSSKRKIGISEINEYDHNTSENVITLHCSRCGQQIDIIG